MWWQPKIWKPKKFAHKVKHLEGKKRFFSCFSAFLLLDGNFLVIRLIVKKDFGKRKNAHLEKVMEATDFETEKVCPQSQGCGTELGLPTTANFCFFRWKMTNILSESNWNQCTYFFHLFPSLDLTVRATAHQKTWHVKENSQRNQKMSIRSAENSS